MANKHYSVNQEINIELSIKLEIQSISNYHSLTEDEIKYHIEDFKKNIASHLKWKLSSKGYYQEEVTQGVDFWNYEIK